MHVKFLCKRALHAGLLLLAAVISQQAYAQNPPVPEDFALAKSIEKTFVNAIQTAEPSVVSIAKIRLRRQPITKRPPNPFNLNPRQNLFRDSENPNSPSFIPDQFGSGVIISIAGLPNERLILTNYHVVRGAPAVGTDATNAEFRLHIRFQNRHSAEARIFAADPRSDLAVLKIHASETGLKIPNLTPIKFGQADNLKKGQLALILSNPYAIARDGSASASWGIISNQARFPVPISAAPAEDELKNETIHHFGTLLQIDARMNLGTSGGALLNLKGELIGITTSLAALDGYEKSAGYAVRLDSATRRIIDSLSQGLEVEYGFLGIEPTDLSTANVRKLSRQINQPTVAITKSVFPSSPAHSAGLLNGDIILSVNGKKVHRSYDLMREIALLGPETIAKLTVWRERIRKELNLSVKLGKWPVVNETDIIATNTRFPEWRGLTVDFPTARSRFISRPNLYPAAVLVTKINPQSAAAKTDIRIGDFISLAGNRKVASPAEFQQVTQQLSGPVTLQLTDGRSIVLP